MQETPSALPEAEKSWKDILPELSKVFGNLKQRLNPKRPKAHFFHSGRIRRGKKMLMGSGSQKKNFLLLNLKPVYQSKMGNHYDSHFLFSDTAAQRTQPG